MLETIVHAVMVLVGLVVLAALWAALRRWGGLAESRALIGEALLLGSRGTGPEQEP